MSFVRCSACTNTVSRLVSASRRQNSISLGSVNCMLALNSLRVFLTTNSRRFGVGILAAPRSSCRYSESALLRVAAAPDGIMMMQVDRGENSRLLWNHGTVDLMIRLRSSFGFTVLLHHHAARRETAGPASCCCNGS